MMSPGWLRAWPANRFALAGHLRKLSREISAVVFASNFLPFRFLRAATGPRFRLRRILSGFALFACLKATAASPADPAPPLWWRDAVFYEVFVRSFADASTGPLAHDGVGDLQGLIERLDYLNDGDPRTDRDLGVTALWLMPIHPAPSYHGYDVIDYLDVHPEFGDIELFRIFVREAHGRGMRVIIDFVLNHASSQHPLFRTALAAPAGSMEQELFRFTDALEQVTNPWNTRNWHAAGDAYYYGFFDATMPDWNFRDPRVTKHHQRAARFWLEDMGVDGFRLDAVRYFFENGDAIEDLGETKSWLRDFTQFCHAVKPDAFVVGECYAPLPIVADYLQAGALDSAFEFELARGTIEAVRLRTPGLLARTLQRLGDRYEGVARWSTFLANHDQDRVRTQLGDSLGAARLAAKLQFTLPGVPFVYYGEEIGLRGAKPDPDLRPPMPWTGGANGGFTSPAATPWRALNPDFDTINVAAAAADPASLLALYRRLVRLNRDSLALRHGRPLALRASDHRIYAAMREAPGEVVLVLSCVGATPTGDWSLSLDRSLVRGDWLLTEELEGAAVTPPSLTSTGGFSAWRPLPAFEPEAVYVLRWRAPARE